MVGDEADQNELSFGSKFENRAPDLRGLGSDPEHDPGIFGGPKEVPVSILPWDSSGKSENSPKSVE